MLKTVLYRYSKARSFTRSFVSALVGFFVYGFWSYCVNSAHGESIATKAFYTQGSVSFIVTLVLTQFMEIVYFSIDRKWLAFILSSLGASVSVVVFSFSVNYLLATPEIFMSIFPGAVVSTVYSFTYTFFLLNKKYTLFSSIG